MLNGSVSQLSVVCGRHDGSRSTVAALAASITDVISGERDITQTTSQLRHQTAIGGVHVLFHLIPLLFPHLGHLDYTQNGVITFKSTDALHFTSPPGRVRNIVMSVLCVSRSVCMSCSMYICLCSCLSARISQKHMPKFRKIFRTLLL